LLSRDLSDKDNIELSSSHSTVLEAIIAFSYPLEL
jgi:hypothetical protein